MTEQTPTDPITAVSPPPEAFMDKLVAFLSNGTVRRLAVFLLGLLVPILNKKFGWEFDPAVIIADVVLALGYVVSSNGKEAVQMNSDAKVAIAEALGPKAAPVAIQGPSVPA